MTHDNRIGSHRQGEPPDKAQLDIFEQRRAWSADSPAGKFEAFHDANPQVWDVLLHEARRWKVEGRGRLGIALLVGRIRWVLTVQTNSTGDGFRINDHFGAFYARLLMHRHPELDGLFELRRALDADDWIAELKTIENGRAA